jgi:hypothetical protein
MTKAMTRVNDFLPEMFDDFLKPWNERFNGNIWVKKISILTSTATCSPLCVRKKKRKKKKWSK